MIHLIIVHRVLQEKIRIPRAINALSKVLHMRKEWIASGCADVSEAKNKGIVLPNISELDLAARLTPRDNWLRPIWGDHKSVNEMFEKAIEVLKIIEGG